MKKQLISLMTIGIVAAMLGAGTMAYFSDTEKVGITFTSGTPNLELSFNGEVWSDSLTYSFPKWSPGDVCSMYVWTRNTGDVGLYNLFVTGDNLVGPNTGLADVINITDVAYTDRNPESPGDPNYWIHPAGGTHYETVFGDKAWPFTLRELAMGLTNGEKMNFCWGTPGQHGDYLPANSAMVQKFYIEFTFNENAGNEWKGKSCGFELLFRGTDEPGDYVWWP